MRLGNQQKNLLVLLAVARSASTEDFIRWGFRKRVIKSIMENKLIEKVRSSSSLWRLTKRDDWNEILKKEMANV